MSIKQNTINNKVLLKGFSLDNKECIAELIPAEGNTGITFILQDGTKIEASYENIKIQSDFTTSLQKGNIELRTIEHIMSAIWGMGIDNIIIKVPDNKIPLIDGSAEYYTKKIQDIGIKILDQDRRYLNIQETFKITYSKDPIRFAILRPSSNFKISANIDYTNIIGFQEFGHTWSAKKYVNDICWARSFFNSPLDLNNEVWNRVRKKIKLLPEDPKKSPIIVYNENNYITPLKDPLEQIRHKILDFYGDIALLGIRLKTDIYINKPSHDFTREIVSHLKNLKGN